jgi:hypothetical protein
MGRASQDFFAAPRPDYFIRIRESVNRARDEAQPEPSGPFPM